MLDFYKQTMAISITKKIIKIKECHETVKPE